MKRYHAFPATVVRAEEWHGRIRCRDAPDSKGDGANSSCEASLAARRRKRRRPCPAHQEKLFRPSWRRWPHPRSLHERKTSLAPFASFARILL